MNLEEAKANIGKEFVLDESTKPYTFISHLSGVIKKCSQPNDDQVFTIHNTEEIGNVLVRGTDAHRIHPRHIKLKEKPMNYKIRVTPETSTEVQELFFALGFEWGSGRTHYYHPSMDIIFVDDDGMFFREKSEVMPKGEYQEITLPQLRDMVVLKRNDMNDATHKDSYGRLWIIGDNVQYLWNLDSKSWKETQPMNLTFKELKNIEHISIETIINDKECQKEMTWQDALRAVADGKEIQQYCLDCWVDINQHIEFSLYHFKNGKFRLKPKTVTLEAGQYTKEELLKIAGEIE